MKEQPSKHCDMIIAKAKNMDLVQLLKVNDEWIECKDNQVIMFDERCEYFLCLPRHNEACLHWLDGGKVLADGEPYWNDAPQEWCNQNDFMSADIEFRIKPETEERWVIATPEALASVIFKSKKLAEQAAKGGQVIKIEIEV